MSAAAQSLGRRALAILLEEEWSARDEADYDACPECGEIKQAARPQHKKGCVRGAICEEARALARGN